MRLVLSWVAAVMLAAALVFESTRATAAENVAPPVVKITAARSPLSVKAERLRGVVQLDGRLSEGSWQTCQFVGSFTQEAPRYGKGATSPTEVCILYDDEYLYVGARMHHPARRGRITPLVHRRDRDSASDWFGVAIDSLNDRRTAFEFRVNAAGVQRDVLINSDREIDDTWDGIWDSSVQVAPDAWVAEMRIPMALLRVRGGEAEQVWGINCVRIDQSPQEVTRLHVVDRRENAFVSRFPPLVGLVGLKPQERRELMPYVTLRSKLATAEDFDDRDVTLRAGIDAHIGLGRSSLLDMTFLPDFGQTEVDQVVLNLSTVETFFPEKRSFFLEGTEIFRMNGLRLFYSRRIGRAAPSFELARGETLRERPLTLDILGAAKFTGKYENGLNVGLLAAETEPAYARVRTADGSVVTREVMPTTYSGVARVLQQLGHRGSYVGAFSSLYREQGAAGRTAYVGALDGTWKSADSSAQLDGLGAFSSVAGDSGAYANTAAVQRWDAGWYASANGVYASPRFDPNDLGYLERADKRSVRLEAGRQWDQSWNALRNWSFYASGTYSQDQNARAFEKILDGRISTEFTNGWNAYVGGGINLPYYNDRELRTFLDPVKKYLYHDEEPYLTTGFGNARNSVWYNALDLSFTNYAGGATYFTTWNQILHVTSRLELQLETTFMEAHGEPHWLETQATTPIVGLRRQRELGELLRASYAFAPNVTFQAYMQFLLASWNYRDLMSYVDDDTWAPGARADVTASNEHDWNVNLLLRWEILPGSIFHAVYTHSAFTDGLFNRRARLSRRAVSELLKAPADDVVQLKLSWLFR